MYSDYLPPFHPNKFIRFCCCWRWAGCRAGTWERIFLTSPSRAGAGRGRTRARVGSVSPSQLLHPAGGDGGGGGWGWGAGALWWEAGSLKLQHGIASQCVIGKGSPSANMTEKITFPRTTQGDGKYYENKHFLSDANHMPSNLTSSRIIAFTLQSRL